MTSSPIQNDLNTLREYVREATKRGGFLLSTNSVTNYWVVTNELHTPKVADLVSQVLQVCLPNIQREDQMVAVFVPRLTRTSEDHFGWPAVSNRMGSRTSTSTVTGEDEFPWNTVMTRLRSAVMTRLGNTAITKRDNQTLNYYELDFDREQKDLGKVVNIPADAPTGTWLGMFSISPHVDLITSAVDSMRHHKRDIKTILVIIERDKVTRQRLQERHVRLVPLIVCDESGDPKTILEMNQLPYSDYHKYFVTGESR